MNTYYYIIISTVLTIYSQTALGEHINPQCIIITSPSCHICTTLKPSFQSIQENPELTRIIEFTEITFDKTNEIIEKYQITKIPTLCLIDHNNQLVKKIEGIKNINNATEEIQSLLEKHLIFPYEREHYQYNSYKKYTPSRQETKMWLLQSCKNMLIGLQDNINHIIKTYL